MKKKLLAAVYWVSIAFITGLFFAGGFAYRTYSDCRSAFSQARGNLLVAGLRGHEPAAATEIYDSMGNLMATACVENRYPVAAGRQPGQPLGVAGGGEQVGDEDNQARPARSHRVGAQAGVEVGRARGLQPAQPLEQPQRMATPADRAELGRENG